MMMKTSLTILLLF